MSNTPNNPFNPMPPEKGPWLYSGAQPTPAYTPPPPPPAARPVGTGAAVGAAADVPKTEVAGGGAKPKVEPAKEAPKSDDNSLASIIDTIEAVIIALILALTFRAFIIEAFVIPTGSMAPTLLGAHFNVVCPQCGYTYSRDASLTFQQRGNGMIDNFGQHAELTDNTIVPADGMYAVKLICPNCQYMIPYESLPQFLGNRPIDLDHRPSKQSAPKHEVPFAWANNGDRILVLKYIYSIVEPTRFDVIVFKEPMQAQDNFIKRLIGLPGETIEIIGGDIYVGAPGKREAADLWIARKPEYVQRDVWQNVYDNDYYPKDEGVRRLPSKPRPVGNELPESFEVWHNPWTGGGATQDHWNRKAAPGQTGPVLKTVGGPVIHYDAAEPGMLEFNAAGNAPYTYNVLGYNDDILDLYTSDSVPPLLPVGDLRLETTWTPKDDAGAWVALSVGADRNRFRVKWSKEGLELLHYDVVTRAFVPVEKVDAGKQAGPEAGKSYHVAINNVDHAVQFFIDGKMVMEHVTPWNAAQALEEAKRMSEALKEDQGNIMEAFGAHVDVSVGGACSLGHLKVLRDLYYTQSIPNRGRYPGAANMDLPLTLGEDEFFAMGDNSRESHDGRTWNMVFPALDDLGTRRGIVPRRYLLGKAIFVYWPAGFRFADKIPVPLVPNAGDMRFIR